MPNFTFTIVTEGPVACGKTRAVELVEEALHKLFYVSKTASVRGHNMEAVTYQLEIK